MTANPAINAVTPAVLRTVDAAMRISLHGWYWSVLQVPGACVGGQIEVVQTHPSGALTVSTGNGQPRSTLASPLEPVHSLPHMCPQSRKCASLDICSKAGGQAHQCSCPAPHAGCTPHRQPVSMPLERTHSHTDGTAHVAPVCDSTSIGQAAKQGLLTPPLPHKTGSDKAPACCDLQLVVIARNRRFRPLVPSKLNALIVHRAASSMQVFVWNTCPGGASNA